jgi:hypothetical protein
MVSIFSFFAAFVIINFAPTLGTQQLMQSPFPPNSCLTLPSSSCLPHLTRNIRSNTTPKANGKSFHNFLSRIAWSAALCGKRFASFRSRNQGHGQQQNILTVSLRLHKDTGCNGRSSCWLSTCSGFSISNHTTPESACQISLKYTITINSYCIAYCSFIFAYL